jgi:hypothetical protein
MANWHAILVGIGTAAILAILAQVNAIHADVSTVAGLAISLGVGIVSKLLGTLLKKIGPAPTPTIK